MKPYIQHLHFVGIGGVGMSGLAEVYAQLGYTVSGSDQQPSITTERLTRLGLRVDIGHRAEQIRGADVVAISSAVAADNPEVRAAQAQGIPVVLRAVLLAELLRMREGIAVAGTHGKTTTSSLMTGILREAGRDPSWVIGGVLGETGSNAQWGTGAQIVVEADESDASFLHLSPIHAVITNIDADHMETYAHDFAQLEEAFLDFIARLPFYGVLTLCLDDPALRALLPRIARPVITYGCAEDAMLRADAVEALPGGAMRFVAVYQPEHAPMGMRRNTGRTCAAFASAPPSADWTQLPITLQAAGLHNVRNALATIGLARALGIEAESIQRALARFGGVGRRFQQYIFPLPGGGHVRLIDDYGHHPTEIATTLAAARAAWPGQRVLLVFQPHRYSRTRDCFADFVRVLSEAATLPSALLLAELYPAGEAPLTRTEGEICDSHALARALHTQGCAPLAVAPLADLPDLLRTHACVGDIILSMGAGSIGQLPQLLACTPENRL